VSIAAALVVVGLLLFLLFLNRFIHRLRPVAVASLVGKGRSTALSGHARRRLADARCVPCVAR
jgi:hypothetical protein